MTKNVHELEKLRAQLPQANQAVEEKVVREGEIEERVEQISRWDNFLPDIWTYVCT